MLMITGVYLLVVSAGIAGDVTIVEIRRLPSIEDCEKVRSSNLYQDPKYVRVECMSNFALVSESLVNGTVDKLSGALNQLRRGF